MAENRFKARQEKRAEEQTTTMAKASGKDAGTVDKTTIQVYVSKELKKRLKMYCLESDENMTSVLNTAIDEYLKSKGC